MEYQMAEENLELFEIEDDLEESNAEKEMSDKKLEEQFNKGRLRVIQEKNDFFYRTFSTSLKVVNGETFDQSISVDSGGAKKKNLA
jgi:hypothetical protein